MTVERTKIPRIKIVEIHRCVVHFCQVLCSGFAFIESLRSNSFEAVSILSPFTSSVELAGYKGLYWVSSCAIMNEDEELWKRVEYQAFDIASNLIWWASCKHLSRDRGVYSLTSSAGRVVCYTTWHSLRLVTHGNQIVRVNASQNVGIHGNLGGSNVCSMCSLNDNGESAL